MARVPIIPTSELTLENVPSPEDVDACHGFALSFDGYGFAGGGVEELCKHLENLPADEDGIWALERITVDDIRADLFAEQRATRWNYQGSEEYEREGWDRIRGYAVGSVRMIRHKLFGEPLTG